MGLLEKLNPKRIKGAIGEKILASQGAKAAAALALSYNVGGKVAVAAIYKKWYGAIDSAIAEDVSEKELKFWNKTMAKTMKKSVVGMPNDETLFLQGWLEGFLVRLNEHKMTEEDKSILKDRLKPYIQDCEKNQLSLLIQDMGLMK